jgi:hypothetical protein
MAGTSPRHEAAVVDGGQDAPGPPDALGAPNMHDSEDSLETHGAQDSLGMTHSPNPTEANNLEEDHDVGKAMHAVLNTVSSRLTSKAAVHH